MSERKTIKINPEIFNISGNKTKKNREKKELPSMKPLISPNSLKNKLLKRIKEHKDNETKQKDQPKTVQEKYTDEFFDSMNYLNNLSKQKKINDEKQNYERNVQKKREELQRKTVKNYAAMNTFSGNNTPMVQLELPEELKEPIITSSPITFNIQTTPAMNLKYKVDNEVPYGVLKGGYKPTYKTLNKTVRNYEISSPTQALTINTNNPTSVVVEREKKLSELREKLKEKQAFANSRSQAINVINNNVEMNRIAKPILNNLEKYEAQNLSLSSEISNTDNTNNINIIQSQNGGNSNNNSNRINSSIPSNIFIPKQPAIPKSLNNSEEDSVERFKKEIVKKTIRRKYKLGKSKTNNKVSILIKDRNTRKNIINAQKDLRKKPLNDVKNYLHSHGLIKIGSNAPNDILRKMYEYSMLSGEINNNSADVLLHNYLKDKTNE